MPPEHDDNRERQLAALRRYVSDLDVRRQHNGRSWPAEERRRGVGWPWLLVTLVLMAVSLAGGIAIGGRDQPDRSPAAAAVTATSAVAASPTATPQCAEAVERANKSISYAVSVSSAMREHTEVMNDLLNGKIDTSTALRTGTPSLIEGSAEAARFDVALADYRKVVDRCRLQAP